MQARPHYRNRPHTALGIGQQKHRTPATHFIQWKLCSFSPATHFFEDICRREKQQETTTTFDYI